MSHHHMNHSKKYSSLADSLFALSDILLSFARIGAGIIDSINGVAARRERSAREHLHNQGLALKNNLTAVRIAHEHEKIHLTVDKQVKSSYEIELLALKVEREKWAAKNAGIGAPQFTADNYPDPGDVRRGQYPAHNYPN